MASSYLYHKNGDATSLDKNWLRLPVGSCSSPSAAVGALKDYESRWFRAMCDAVAQHREGGASPRDDEGYSAYLRRLALRDGLAARAPRLRGRDTRRRGRSRGSDRQHA